MQKNGSIISLFVVALVALGLMAFISLNSMADSSVGNAIQKPSIRPSDAKISVPLESLQGDVIVASDDLNNAIIANTIVTCDVAKAMGVQNKLSQKSISICQNLLYPFI